MLRDQVAKDTAGLARLHSDEQPAHASFVIGQRNKLRLSSCRQCCRQKQRTGVFGEKIASATTACKPRRFSLGFRESISCKSVSGSVRISIHAQALITRCINDSQQSTRNRVVTYLYVRRMPHEEARTQSCVLESQIVLHLTTTRWPQRSSRSILLFLTSSFIVSAEDKKRFLET